MARPAPSYQIVPRLVRCVFDPLGDGASIEPATFRVHDLRELTLAVRRHVHIELPGTDFMVDVSAAPAGQLRTPTGTVIGAFAMTTPPPAELHPAHQPAGTRLRDEGWAGSSMLISDYGAGGRHPMAWAASRLAADAGYTITIVDTPALRPDWETLLANYGPGLPVRHVTAHRIALHPDDVRDPATVYVIVGDRIGERSKAFTALRPILSDPQQPTLVYLHPDPRRPATHILRAVYGSATPSPVRLRRAAAIAEPGSSVPQVLDRPGLEMPQ